MPLLETIRKGTDSTAMRLVFGAIVLVFIFWGIGGNQGPTSQVVATVNGERITDTQFQRIMRDRLRSVPGNQLDKDEQDALARQVLAQLIERKALVQEADRIGIEVSDEELARYLLTIDAFRDSDGRFEMELYKRTLKRMGLKQGQFEEQLREEMKIDKLLEAVAAGISVSEGELKRAWAQQAMSMTLQWVEIPAEALAGRVEVTDAEVDRALAERADEVRAAYDADVDTRWTRPDKATLSTILLRSDLDQGQVGEAELRRRLEGVLAEARGGADFAELARRWSEDLSAVNGGRIGRLAREQLEPAAAEAIFQAAEGAITDVVETTRGFQIFLVQEIERGGVTPFDEAKRVIARELLVRERLGEVARAFVDEVRQRWVAEGHAPTDLLEPLNLRLRTVPGITPSQAMEKLGPVATTEILDAIDAVEGDGVLGPFEVPGSRDGQRWVVLAVRDYQPPDWDRFEKDKAVLRLQIEAAARAAFLQAWRQDLVQRAKVEQFYRP